MPRMEWLKEEGIWSKQCSTCKHVYKAVTDGWNAARSEFLKNFSPNTRAFDEMLSQCNSCRNNRNQNREEIHREELLLAQGNKCGLCYIEISFGDRTAKVDHCHKSGKTRKVLCQKCNVGMSNIDDDAWLQRALAYRDAHRG